jgi:hypothetical protein
MKKILLTVFYLFFCCIIYLNAQQKAWIQLGTGTNALNANGNINNIVADNYGNIYASGWFTDASSQPYIARWNGTAWSELGTGSNALNPFNNDFFVQLDNFGNIYAVGVETTNGGNEFVLKWNGTSWVEVGTGANGLNADNFVLASAVDASNNLYVAGDFGYPEAYVAKFNGTSWTELGTGAGALNANNNIKALTFDNAGNLYAAGRFTDSLLSTKGHQYVAKWNGTSWSELGTGANALNANADINSIVIDGSGNVYVAGDFTNANGNYYVAKWNGTNWSELGTGSNGLNANGLISSMVIDKSGNIYTTGYFTNANRKYYVAMWNGTSWSDLGALDVSQYLITLAIDNNGNIFTAGSLSSAYGTYVVEYTTAAPTVSTPVTYCQNQTPTVLTATGTALKWYASASGGTASTTAPIPPTTAVGTTTYYVSQTVSGVEGSRAAIVVNVNAIPNPPVVKGTISYCMNAVDTALTASGSNLKWYTTVTGGTASSVAPIPSTINSGTTDYYVSQTPAGCVESNRATIAVIIYTLPILTVESPVTYCQNDIAVALTAQTVTGTGSAPLWYTVSSKGTASGTAPIPSTATVGTTYYYVLGHSVINGCNTPMDSIAVTVNAIPAAPTVTSPIIYCQGASTYTLTANGTSLLWYTAATGGTGSTNAPMPQTYIIGDSSYYVSQTVTGCESPRATITVTVNSPILSYAGNPQYITTTSTTLAANTAPAPAVGTWSGNAVFSNVNSPTTTVSGLATGANMLTWVITDGNCPTYSSFVIINVGTAPISQSIQGAASVTSGQKGVIYSIPDNSGSTYHWSLPTGAVITSANTDSSQITVSFGTIGGNVSVKQTNSYGSTTDILPVTLASVTTGIQTNTVSNSCEVYPNPFAAYTNLIVKSPDTETIYITISDMQGAIYYMSSNYTTNEEIKLGCQLTVPGIYIVKISYNTQNHIIKLVKVE